MAEVVNVNFKLDSDVKKKMESACADMGLSMSAAFTIFAKKVGRERRIPFEIKATSEPLAYTKGLDAFYALRAEAETNGIQDMTLGEINEEIRKAREENKEEK